MSRWDELADKVGGVETPKKVNKNRGIETRMNIRVSEQLRADFVEACKARDTTAAREIRKFMRKFLEEDQLDMFEDGA